MHAMQPALMWCADGGAAASHTQTHVFKYVPCTLYVDEDDDYEDDTFAWQSEFYWIFYSEITFLVRITK